MTPVCFHHQEATRPWRQGGLGVGGCPSRRVSRPSGHEGAWEPPGPPAGLHPPPDPQSTCRGRAFLKTGLTFSNPRRERGAGAPAPSLQEEGTAGAQMGRRGGARRARSRPSWLEREAREGEATAITDHRRPRGHCGPGCLLSSLC